MSKSFDELYAEVDQIIKERDLARAGIKAVFDMIEHGDLDMVHDVDVERDGHPQCPEDDTCRCRVRRFLLELQIAGGIQADGARHLLTKLPPRGPHDRPDCLCGHPLGELGVCGGCNCADDPP